MSLRFRGEEPHPGSDRPRRPPNYLSRRVQWKVFTLVAMFMLVIILMQEARKPKNWQWMWDLENAHPQDAPPADEEPVDTRLREPPAGSDRLPSPETLVVTGDGAPVSPPEAISTPDESAKSATPTEQSELDAWSRLLSSLSVEDRKCFLSGLKAARDGDPLDDRSTERWPEVVATLDLGWREYLDRAFLAVAEDDAHLNDDEKRLWLQVIEQLKTDWREDLQPALTILGKDADVDENTCRMLERIQDSLDRVFLTTINDSTVFRASEKDAWFRMLERLNRWDLEDVESRSVGKVGFLQVYRQPDEYRGRLVTVQGSLRLGYYRDAPRNIYGISGYYIFWLKPIGSNSPMVVYCLDVPDGFPDVRELEQETDKPELNEAVEFTGFFFKRWAYRSEDGTRLAPLILAKLPRWEPPPDATATLPETPSWPRLAGIIGSAALVSVLFALGVFVMSKHARSPVGIRRKQLARKNADRQPVPEPSDPVDLHIATSDNE